MLTSALPQKEEYVILVRMTTFQRLLYDTFMNEVVRTKAVPNPLKAFAVCCKVIISNFSSRKSYTKLNQLWTANIYSCPIVIYCRCFFYLQVLFTFGQKRLLLVKQVVSVNVKCINTIVTDYDSLN